MFNTRICICEVTFWNDCTNKENTESVICNAANYQEAAAELEQYYGDSMISMKVTPLEEGPLTIRDDWAEMILDDCL